MPAHDPTHLPPGLPAPINDGACLHLRARAVPDVMLRRSDGAEVSANTLCAPSDLGVVVFCYPYTGVPGRLPLPGFAGEVWDTIPGARGCTPQSCGFRDVHGQFRAIRVGVVGLSTNSTGHQAEFRSRMKVPFDLLSDSSLALVKAMNLPTFEFPVGDDGPSTLIKRVAWYCEPDAAGTLRIREVWYPVFPPNENAANVLRFLEARHGVRVEKARASDEPFVRQVLASQWNTRRVWARGSSHDPFTLPTVIARREGRPVGMAVFTTAKHEFEIVALGVIERGAAVAPMLLDAVEDEARAAGASKVFITAPNCATEALAFLQRRGFAVTTVRRGQMDWYRQSEPGIPKVAPNGVPIRDEFEVELTVS